MNIRPITGNKNNLALLKELAEKFLPMIEKDCEQQRNAVNAVRLRLNHFINVQRDMKGLIRRGRAVLKPEALRWAVKQREDAAFDEHRLRGEKDNHMETYRACRQMEFLLKSIVLIAKENEDVSSDA